MNGAAVRLPLPPEPPATTELETALGAAVASAVTALAAAMLGYQRRGMLDPDIKEAGGDRIAKVAELALGHELGDRDFVARAREYGKIRLRQYLDADFYCHNSPEQGEAAIDFYIDGLLEIVTRVVKDERILRAAMAN